MPTDHSVNILGVNISETNIPDTITKIDAAIAANRKGYVCVTGVHGIMESQKNPELKSILNQAFINVPDGMPTVWIGRLKGLTEISRVYGPDLMLRLCEYSQQTGYSHFLYGGNIGVAESLSDELMKKFPQLKIVGTYTPPFRPLNQSEKEQLIQQIKKLQPDIIWVGLSTPKQEIFMNEYLANLDTKIMLGVGAAFDIHTGKIHDAPNWVKNMGFQWLHRLFQEPRRLWKRYLINNPIFIYKFFLQVLGLKKY